MKIERPQFELTRVYAELGSSFSTTLPEALTSNRIY